MGDCELLPLKGCIWSYNEFNWKEIWWEKRGSKFCSYEFFDFLNLWIFQSQGFDDEYNYCFSKIVLSVESIFPFVDYERLKLLSTL